MLDLFHIAKPQGCDIQMFYGSGVTSADAANAKSWTKPRGVSNVYMLLIGAGGSGDGTSGGGCGAVTVWYGSATNVPDKLDVFAGIPGQNSHIKYRTTSNTINILLTANGASGVLGATASTANVFASSGFYQSIAGTNGSTGDPGAVSTTFLQGGGAAGTITSNYGYTTSPQNGYFQLQPIIVGVGGTQSGNGGIGCGSGRTIGSGGPGLVLIASW